MAAFDTEQQSLDVREDIARRVAEGWPSGKARYGYTNVRVDGRGVVEVHPEHGPKVRRIFTLYAYHNLTLDDLIERLYAEGVYYRSSQPRFPRSTLRTILRDRTYIGEVPYKGQWFPGKQEPLVDRATWDRVQVLLGGQLYRSHDENADVAVKAFELSQSLREKWLTADYAAKRRILEIVCLNFRLAGATLVPTMRKPFDVLAEGLLSWQSRGDWI